jgi:hypothetical protein
MVYESNLAILRRPLNVIVELDSELIQMLLVTGRRFGSRKLFILTRYFEPLESPWGLVAAFCQVDALDVPLV